jgi:dolichol-phosphate mannosyltransferase
MAQAQTTMQTAADANTVLPHPLSMIIPVYNEGDNFANLWKEICSKICSEFKAFVIYDFDEDDTVPVVEAIINNGENRIRLVRNRIRKGVVGAIVTGFDQVEHGPVLVVMADLSDDLGQVDSMVRLYRQGYHVVVGSRYMKGGGLEGGPWFKQFLSRMAGLTLHWFRGIPTHDATNAFKIYDRDMLKAFTVESQRGFELNLELTTKAFLRGYRIAEVPSHWQDRSRGHSRFRLWSWLPHYLRWYLYAFQPRQTLQEQIRT